LEEKEPFFIFLKIVFLFRGLFMYERRSFFLAMTVTRKEQLRMEKEGISEMLL